MVPLLSLFFFTFSSQKSVNSSLLFVKIKKKKLCVWDAVVDDTNSRVLLSKLGDVSRACCCGLSGLICSSSFPYHQVFREERVALTPETLWQRKLHLVLAGNVNVYQITCGSECKTLDLVQFQIRDICREEGVNLKEITHLSLFEWAALLLPATWFIFHCFPPLHLLYGCLSDISIFFPAKKSRITEQRELNVVIYAHHLFIWDLCCRETQRCFT